MSEPHDRVDVAAFAKITGNAVQSKIMEAYSQEPFVTKPERNHDASSITESEPADQDRG